MTFASTPGTDDAASVRPSTEPFAAGVRAGRAGRVIRALRGLSRSRPFLWCLLWLWIGARDLIDLAQHKPFWLPGFSLPYWVYGILAAVAFFLLGERP